MGRPTLPSRTREVLADATTALRPTPVRTAVLVGSLAVTLGLHVALRSGTVAWLLVPLMVLAGLAGGTRPALLYAGAAVVGHATLDIAFGLAGAEVLGLLARTAALPLLALVGEAGADLTRARDQAVRRSVSEDAVTGLLNVRVFYEELGRLREAQTPFTILLADIRGMRALNERYGHPTGTEAVRVLAHVLRRAAGDEFTACRLGSDEVAMVMAGADRERTREVVQRVIERLHDEQVVLPDGEWFEVHAAYGLARFPEDGPDEVSVLRAADRAKERAKAAGLDHIASADGTVS
ncbi:MAG TPA: GGDEF domain-containing protein [Egicoccus sp.]|nr:GGDEF domain-containing protein [Egicoccus sp.]HSK21653.1 GGDEF domain-containing protein [Egicoccus sp.]